jgi:hypothetical protein
MMLSVRCKDLSQAHAVAMATSLFDLLSGQENSSPTKSVKQTNGRVKSSR